MSIFHAAFLIAEDNTVISIKFIESMNLAKDREEQTFDKLKDDITLDIKTVSGSEYTISIRRQKEIIGKQYNFPEDLIEIRNCIFEKWITYIS